MKLDTETLLHPATASGVANWRLDFPILSETVRGKPLVYLDNAATTQKPQSVIDVEASYYRKLNANVHRGVHDLSQRATDAYEAARGKVRSFIGAGHDEEIIFVRGATEAINLVAQSYARPLLKAGDEIVVSAMEHHSNIVPWQMVCAANRRRAQGGAGQRRRRTRYGGLCRAAGRADPAGGDDPSVECAGHDHAGGASD